MKTGWMKLVLGLSLSASILTSIAFATPETAKAEGELVESEANDDKLGFTGLKRGDLGIYTLIVFGALLFILGKFAWKPVMEGLDKREETLRKDHEDAERARTEAQEFLNRVQKQLAEASDQVRAMMEEARKQGQALKDAMKADGAKELEAAKAQARREIETAKDSALEQIWTQAVQLASMISMKVVRKELSPELHRQLVEESLSELKQTIASN